MRARLTVESGSAAPRVLEVDDDVAIHLGRSRDNNIVLNDRHASRTHARISASGGCWVLVDAGTTNGTRVNGQPINGEAKIHHGQIIGIGEVRLRFEISNPIEDEDTPDDPHVVVAPVVAGTDTAIFQPDDLSALVRFMHDGQTEPTPNRLVTLALETILAQTGADLAGYLSLDAAPDLRLILPTQASLDRRLSHHLTQQVQNLGRTVWLSSPEGRSLESDSLSNIQDAICIPLKARTAGGTSSGEPALGALHVYRSRQAFNERQVRFCEIVAGSLASALHETRSRRALEADNTRLRERGSPNTSEDLIGSSRAMSALRQQISRLAGSNCTILIIGESGAGKELVALGLHHQSPRHRGPLVPVNCAAINLNMAESELFGHVKGAFTGAMRDHHGYFGQADMGTLFLDEIGELSPDLQAKLLRAIETKSIRPVGAKQETRVDVRIIAATNRNLEREVQEGRFRRDLYFRLTSRIVIPPIRDHIEDVPELVAHFLDHFNAESHKRVTISPAALQRLGSYHWPGNVRQLRAVLEGAVALAAENGEILAGDLHLPDDKAEAVAEKPPTLNLEALEEWAIGHALKQAEGNNSQAAKLLGIHRSTLIEKMKRYGIEREG